MNQIFLTSFENFCFFFYIRRSIEISFLNPFRQYILAFFNFVWIHVLRCYVLFPIDDSTWDEAAEITINPNQTVRFQLRSGELKSKNGITHKMLVKEVRTPKSKRRCVESRDGHRVVDTSAIPGPSGIQNSVNQQPGGSGSDHVPTMAEPNQGQEGMIPLVASSNDDQSPNFLISNGIKF